MKILGKNYSRHIAIRLTILSFILVFGSTSFAADPFKEINGLVVIEAENFHSKDRMGAIPDWYVVPSATALPTPDPDADHSGNAGNGKYVEVLPDRRVNDADGWPPQVIFGDPTNAPRLNYRVFISSPGRYYIRARTNPIGYLVGGEDNGCHFGLDNSWPASGIAAQWCAAKEGWMWTGHRRTAEVHCGVLNLLYLDLTAGEHTIRLAMREDGAEVDRFLLTKDSSYFPTDVGPAESPRTTGGTPPANVAPTVNAGTDQVVNAMAANLDGSVTDDGLPANTLTSQWSKVSGPGTVTFGNATAPKTTATFSAVGVYVLQLSGSDGALSRNDNVQIDVRGGTSPTNVAPVVNAGPDQVINTLTANLDGSATDDGLPNGTLTSRWSLVSELSTPGAQVTFQNATAPKTTVTFGAAGRYVLQLTASDGALSKSDKIGFYVNQPPPNPQNQAPKVNAGPDQMVKLSESAALTGSATDDGIPNSTLTTNWKMLSGPGIADIANPSSLQTTVGFNAIGSYVLELSAHDGALTGADTIAIQVIEAPAPTTAFLQDANGLVVMEAENHDANVDYGTHGWERMAQDGTSAMEAAPDAGVRIASNYVSTSPYLRFNVNFVKTGTHYIWLRGLCTGNDNSAHAGLDGKASTSSENITLPVNWGWVWSQNAGGKPATVYVNQTGLHTVEIWMREDGFILDKVLLTTSMNYTPIGAGPVESPRK